MTEWIPTTGPGGRLPTDEDADYGPADPRNGCVYGQEEDGECGVYGIHTHAIQYDCVAWMPLPAPYVPPEPEKPKRDRRTVKIAGEENIYVERFPGDPDPDKARKVLEEMVEYDAITIKRVGPLKLKRWIKSLKGEEGQNEH